MTIVNQYPILESGPALLGVLLAICFGICLLIAVLALFDQNWGIMIWFGVFCAFFFISILWVAHGKETDKTCYECLIDGTTPFVEVVENYDIVGRRGDLWVLEDKK